MPPQWETGRQERRGREVGKEGWGGGGKVVGGDGGAWESGEEEEGGGGLKR